MMSNILDHVDPSQHQIEPMNAFDEVLEVLPEAKMTPNNDDVKNPPQTIRTALNKPIRPLTAYHLYFQLEREFIIQSTVSDAHDTKKVDTRPVGLELDLEMPPRYHYIHLSPDWYASGKNKRGSSDRKRKHRKTHGKIAFLDLSRLVASRWATLEETDPETKFYCTKVAKRELDVYKVQVKKYKTSLSCMSNESVTSSFSSTGTSSSTFSLSPISTHISISAECLPKLENQTSHEQRTSGSIGGKCTSRSLKVKTNCANNIKVCHGFHPELMTRENHAPVQHIDCAASGVTGDTRISASTNSILSETDNPTNFKFDPISLSEWCPDSLAEWIGKQDHASRPTDLVRKSAGSTNENVNTNSASIVGLHEASLSSSSSSRNISSEFSFHPVPCDAEDAFLKKYRKLARRTSLLSLRPLDHRNVPMSQSLSSLTTNGNIADCNSIDYERKFNPANPCQEYDLIQIRLREELDERLAQVCIGRYAKGRAIQTSQEQANQEWHCDSASIGASNKKRSSIIHETGMTPSHHANSETLLEFTSNDADMLLSVLSENSNSGGMESSGF